MSQLFGIPLGWIMWLLYKVIPSYGVVLILFTILVKAALFPLSVKQQKSTAKMTVFQPRSMRSTKNTPTISKNSRKR